MLFAWDDKFSVNIREIDEQHKKLVENINKLHEAISAGEGNEVLESILQSLVDYAHTHFDAEEKLMKLYEYPEYEQHKKEHDDLTQKVIEMEKKYKESGSIAMPLHVMKFLKGWLEDHLLNTDKKYVPFFDDKGVN
jgi:hemerythrin